MTDVAAILQKPLEELFGAEHRLFLPFLATSALMAALVWLVRARGRIGLFAYMLSPRLWLHRSAILDYQVMLVRALLAALVLAPFAVSSVAVAIRCARSARELFGPSDLHVHPPIAAIVCAFTIVAFVADDLTRYLVHRLMHRVPFLWELHKVHHSAEVLTPFTLQRVHPLEGLINGVRGAVTLGVVTGAFMWLFPGRVRGYAVLGVDAIGFVFALAGANLRHSHVWLSYGPFLERFVISPAQHQIHHSSDPEHYDRNYGAALSIWDWMFGSLYVTRTREQLQFGLSENERNHGDDVGSVLIRPVVAAARRILPRRSRQRPFLKSSA
jgi:sterol desaturase/sphingolipid hydroxylase (fatty acid hydroxylase superfamily)